MESQPLPARSEQLSGHTTGDRDAAGHLESSPADIRRHPLALAQPSARAGEPNSPIGRSTP